MNDSSELDYGMNIFDNVAQAYGRSLEDSGQNTIRDLRNNFKQVVNLADIHIFCLCEEKNLLNQWRDYGNDTISYCIGFNSNQLLNLYRDHFRIRLAKIVYDQVIQRKILTKTLSDLYEHPDGLSSMGEAVEKEKVDRMVYAISTIFSVIVRFKDHAFADEREWRVIALIDQNNTDAELGFRASNLGVIPYYI